MTAERPQGPHAADCELAGARIAAGIRELLGEGGLRNANDRMAAAELASGIALALNLILNALEGRR